MNRYVMFFFFHFDCTFCYVVCKVRCEINPWAAAEIVEEGKFSNTIPLRGAGTGEGVPPEIKIVILLRKIKINENHSKSLPEKFFCCAGLELGR